MIQPEQRDKIDAHILRLIDNGVSRFDAMYRTSFLRQFDFRVTDRRLQALRKQGKIIYARKSGWQIVEVT